MAPRINKPSATRITLFLPSLSARTLATRLAMRAKRLVELVIRLLSSVSRGRYERSEPMETRVEDMTPVLYHMSSQLVVLCGRSGAQGITHSQTRAH